MNPSEAFEEAELRRLSQNRANVPGPTIQPGVPRQPIYGSQDFPAQGRHEEASVQRPTFGQPPSQSSAAPSASPESAAMLQMLSVLQQQMAHQQQQMAQQQQLINEFFKQGTLNQKFRYEKEIGITFKNWYSRYTDLFQKDAARIDDPAKVRLLLRKLGAAKHDWYLSFIMPSRPSDFSLEDTVVKLTALFDTEESLLSRRFKCLQLTKKPTEDHLSYACRINKACVVFELGKLNEDDFKTLLFVCGLKDEADSDLRTRLLARIEKPSAPQAQTPAVLTVDPGFTSVLPQLMSTEET
ncbi:uncharacterized protein LOC131269390 [Anopheles coustani]|uniref:uncharacterized protein LOC131269390 n=1 Tax=Anopheles coustani TaxID=139045 RepID=UPI002657BA95|nr:uncharacterized protein LOC131269390 [Anopheles coustani]